MKYDYFRILYKTDPYSIMSKKRDEVWVGVSIFWSFLVTVCDFKSF